MSRLHALIPVAAVLAAFCLLPGVAGAAADPANPLGLTVPPPIGDAITGATPFIDWNGSLAAIQARRWRHRYPAKAATLSVLASQPGVQRYGNWSGPDPGRQVSEYLQQAAMLEPGSVPELSTYYLVDGKRIGPRCRHYADPAWRQGAYHKWIESLAGGIGSDRTIVFLEMDSLITVGCLSHHGLVVRLHELHDAIDILARLPRVAVYLDAGAADAPSGRRDGTAP